MPLNRRTRAAPDRATHGGPCFGRSKRAAVAARGWICRCPAHDDHHPSLSIAERDGKVLIKCWGGCGQDPVLDGLRSRKLWSGKYAPTPLARPRPSSSAAESGQVRDPMKSWTSAAQFVRNSPADIYLRTSCGIELSGETRPRASRFAPALWHWPTQSRWPAMVARV